MMNFYHNASPQGYKIEHRDEDLEYSEEPHATRRRAILKKYPQIKKLMGYDPTITFIVAAEVALQMIFCYLIQDACWVTVFISAYAISACFNHSLGSAIHEIGHNLAFGHRHPLANRALGMFCNLPLVVPMSVRYRKYHSEHHRWLGHGTNDVDVPTASESYLFQNALTKTIWLVFNPIIRSVRSLRKNPKPLTALEIVNTGVQCCFNIFIYHTFGVKSLVYLLLGTLFGWGLHPFAGLFISAHDMHHKTTHSYYGPLNYVLFNAGYHVEHHDFPYIPYRNLPEVRRVAAEYYDNLPYHTSLFKVLFDFIFRSTWAPHPSVNPSNIGDHTAAMEGGNCRELLPHQDSGGQMEIHGNVKGIYQRLSKTSHNFAH